MVKEISRTVGKFLRIIFPLRLLNAVLGILRYVYTGYVSKQFFKFGSSSIIKYPSSLIGEKFISIEENVSIGKRSCITAWGEKNNPIIFIGKNTDIGDDCHITGINKIIIGNNVLFGKKVTVTDNSHGACNNYKELLKHPSQRKVISKNGVIIKDNVWVGDKVTILPGVTIGRGVIIGANSVVSKDIQSYSVAAGIPAKVIKSFKNK